MKFSEALENMLTLPNMRLFLLLALFFGCFISSPGTAWAAGILEVGSNSFSGIIPRNGVAIPFLTLYFRAQDDPVEITTLTIRRGGLSSSDDIGNVWAGYDDYRRSHRASFLNTDLAHIRFRSPLIIQPEEIKEVTIYANLEDVNGGQTILFTLEDLESDAQNILIDNSLFTPESRGYKLQRLQQLYEIRHLETLVCRNRRCYRVAKPSPTVGDQEPEYQGYLESRRRSSHFSPSIMRISPSSAP